MMEGTLITKAESDKRAAHERHRLEGSGAKWGGDVLGERDTHRKPNAGPDMDMASVWKRKVLSSRTGRARRIVTVVGRALLTPGPRSDPRPCLLLPQNNVCLFVSRSNPRLIKHDPSGAPHLSSSATTLHVIPTNALPQGLLFFFIALSSFLLEVSSLRFPVREPCTNAPEHPAFQVSPPHNILPAILLRHPT